MQCKPTSLKLASRITLKLSRTQQVGNPQLNVLCGIGFSKFVNIATFFRNSDGTDSVDTVRWSDDRQYLTQLGLFGNGQIPRWTPCVHDSCGFLHCRWNFRLVGHPEHCSPSFSICTCMFCFGGRVGSCLEQEYIMNLTCYQKTVGLLSMKCLPNVSRFSQLMIYRTGKALNLSELP